MSAATWSPWRQPIARVRSVDFWNRRERRLEKKPAYDWAEWLRALDGESGVYAFRDRETHGIFYIGHSRTGRLYSTITRHWQSWASPTNRTFDPTWCECRVLLCSDEEAPILEAIAIQLAQDAGEPLDNEQNGRSYMPDDDDQPF